MSDRGDCGKLVVCLIWVVLGFSYFYNFFLTSNDNLGEGLSHVNERELILSFNVGVSGLSSKKKLTPLG